MLVPDGLGVGKDAGPVEGVRVRRLVSQVHPVGSGGAGILCRQVEHLCRELEEQGPKIIKI